MIRNLGKSKSIPDAFTVNVIIVEKHLWFHLINSKSRIMDFVSMVA